MFKAVVIASAVVAASAGKAKEATAKTASKTESKTIALNDGHTLADVTLTSSCSPPTKLGGVGYCGPDFCGALMFLVGPSRRGGGIPGDIGCLMYGVSPPIA